MPVAMLSSSLMTNPQRYGRFNALDTENPFGTKLGMVLMKPTSISNSGGTATLGTNGQVTFSGITSVSMNGVFTADFDNYMMFIGYDNDLDSNSFDLQARLRASGTDASGSDYNRQRLTANAATVGGNRTTESLIVIGRGGGNPSGSIISFYKPFVAQPTACRGSAVDSSSGGQIAENVTIHTLSSSYDGLTVFPGSGKTIAGNLTIVGVRS